MPQLIAELPVGVRLLPMATLSHDAILTLLQPYLPMPLQAEAVDQLSAYLDLLVKWNARTNLTAIRTPEEMVRRHFGESLFAASLVPRGTSTLLDLGSGGGFPGVPLQILRPEIAVTLAESQGKKATFLREVVRSLGLRATVWADRAEKLEKKFDVVAMRAVDKMEGMIPVAVRATRPGGILMLLTTKTQTQGLNLKAISQKDLPNSQDGVVAMFHVEHDAPR